MLMMGRDPGETANYLSLKRACEGDKALYIGRYVLGTRDIVSLLKSNAQGDVIESGGSLIFPLMPRRSVADTSANRKRLQRLIDNNLVHRDGVQVTVGQPKVISSQRNGFSVAVPIVPCGSFNRLRAHQFNVSRTMHDSGKKNFGYELADIRIIESCNETEASIIAEALGDSISANNRLDLSAVTVLPLQPE